jgi:hypothetical protein
MLGPQMPAQRPRLVRGAWGAGGRRHPLRRALTRLPRGASGELRHTRPPTRMPPLRPAKHLASRRVGKWVVRTCRVEAAGGFLAGRSHAGPSNAGPAAPAGSRRLVCGRTEASTPAGADSARSRSFARPQTHAPRLRECLRSVPRSTWRREEWERQLTSREATRSDHPSQSRRRDFRPGGCGSATPRTGRYARSEPAFAWTKRPSGQKKSTPTGGDRGVRGTREIVEAKPRLPKVIPTATTETTTTTTTGPAPSQSKFS